MLRVPERGQNGHLGDGAQSDHGKTDFFPALHCAAASALAVRATEALIADGFVVEVAKVFYIFEDFVDGVHNVVHIFLWTEEVLMREPNSFVIGSFFRFRAGVSGAQVDGPFAIPTECWEIGGVHGEKRAFVDRFVKEAVAMDAFKLHGGNES